MKLGSLFQNGMVLLQNEKNCIYGYDNPLESINLTFKDKTYSSRTNKKGQWKIIFNPGQSGGPFDLTIENSNNNKIILNDVYVGEVWLCSGQSNMELPMERLKYTYPSEITASKNEYIRFFTVPISYSFDGEKTELPSGKWLPACTENIKSFSGTSYFFAKKIQQEMKVPVGIINASQGGSPISSWLDEKTVKKWPEYSSLLNKCKDETFIKDSLAKALENNSNWYKKSNDEDIGFKDNWFERPFDITSNWDDFIVPGKITNLSGGGTIWLKKEFILNETEVQLCNKMITHLWMGTIVDSDITWINGIECGTTGYEYPPRRYIVPHNTLKVGKNCITIRVSHNYSSMIVREDKPYFLFTENVNIKPTQPGNLLGTDNNAVLGKTAVCVDLKGIWKMKIGCSIEKKPDEVFFEWKPTALYNNMLAPCFKYAVRGFVWYQGESDTHLPQFYQKQLSQMIKVWRKKFIYCAGNKSPFIIIQLPNCGEKDENGDTGWFAIREAEKKVAFTNKNCGLVVTIDIGEWNDIHPENKEIVGTRSAYEAFRLSYKNIVPVSPHAVSIKKTADGAIIIFSDVVICRGDSMPVITCLLANKENKMINCCLTVKAIAHNKVITMIPSDFMGKGWCIRNVKYNWCDSPVSSVLFDKSGELPVVPFCFYL